MAVLNWKHHTLIQSLMSRGPLKEDDFHKIFSSVTGKNPRTCGREFNDFLLKINKELSYVQMELRRCRNQNDGQLFYGLVNNVSDDQSKLGSKYSVPQITLFKAAIEAIVQDATAQGSISWSGALNIRLENQVYNSAESQSQGSSSQVPPALRNFSLSQKEKTLDELVCDKWLCRTPDGGIGLGVRSYLDLRSWFHNSGTPPCQVCNEAAIKAKVCQNESCTLRIHHYCLKKKISQSRGKIVCPTCGIEWECQVPKCEAVDVEYEQNDPTESQPPVGSKRKKLKANINAEADAARGSSSQASQPIPDLRRVTRSSAQTRSMAGMSWYVCAM
ncbi:non-structural maintenance of chromosomes element 1 homolog isoform X3 [Ricinus communis]|uniref:non-structural maintenance of chromosomes element 1 homolog isoform X3 n=1 Tax=Ricinus communis TaxID=3988 RepID=UPI0007725AD6|nr:non-structural maintenance of chromosomes element 1 homolog isoform X3 [Ricinus communis]|eukprot:XP_015576319.1 non-structural maintenance of chromosomes element 1 homolog isoform X3 [Ricinus communis]